jgi:hypothetical protein
VTIATELAGSALILTGIYRWLGAWLVAYQGSARCSPRSSQIDFGNAATATLHGQNSFFEHGLVGGFLLVAWLDLRKSEWRFDPRDSHAER